MCMYNSMTDHRVLESLFRTDKGFLLRLERKQDGYVQE